MEPTRNTRPVVAVIGGGQLTRMMQESAIALGIELRPLVEAPDTSTALVVASSTVGLPKNDELIHTLIEGADVLTFRHEHIPQTLLAQLKGSLAIEPPAHALLYAQDKLAVRERLTQMGAPCPRWARIGTLEHLQAFGDECGWPLVVKAPTGDYDGRGVRVIHEAEEAAEWFGRGELLAEELVPFVSEVATLCARRPSGQIKSWPVATSEQVDGICSVVTTPAFGVRPETLEAARKLGERIAEELGVTGVLAVEVFVVGEGADERILVNELTMRPHNTGHWTIDGAVTSQFEQHLRAVLDLPLGSTELHVPGSSCIMVNLLDSSFPCPARALGQALEGHPEAKVHIYSKTIRPGRKLGHVTVMDAGPARTRAEAKAVVTALRDQV